MTQPELASMDPTGIEHQIENKTTTTENSCITPKELPNTVLIVSICRNASIALLKATGKVKCLEEKVEAQKGSLNMEGIHTQHVGIAHTRLP